MGRMGGKGRPHRAGVAPRLPSTIGPAILIVVVTAAAYFNSFGGVLVFDDTPAIAENPNIRSLWPPSRSMAAPLDTTVSGRPIVSLTLALNYALAPGAARDVFAAPREPASHSDAVYQNLWGYHAVNLTIHVLAALTLFGVIRRTLLSPAILERFAAAATPLAMGIALIWAVHPLQTGSVTYVVQRAESLMGLFYLLTLYCAIRAVNVVEAPHVGSGFSRTYGWMLAAICACALGMGTKEVMVTAPLMVVLWDWVFIADRGLRIADWEQRMAGRRRLYIGLAATWVILAALLASGPRSHSVGFGVQGWSWQTYLVTQLAVIGHYLRLCVVPFPLVLDYEWPAARSIADVAAPALVVVSLVVLSVWMLARRRPIGFAGAWFFGILVPTSSVIPIATEVAAEHRLYLPLASVVAVVVLGSYAVAARLKAPAFSRAMGLAAAAVVVAFAMMTDARNRDYQDDERIWLDTIQKRPSNGRARANYATSLVARGRYEEAEEHLRVAIQIKPDYPEAHAALGVALCARGRFDEGLVHLQRAIAIQPDYAAAHQDLGEAYASRGELGAAARSFARALALRPDDVTLLNRTGWILATARDNGVRNGREAVELAERATRLTTRRDVISLDTLAAAYAEVGRFDDAVSVARQALDLARANGDQTMAAELDDRLAGYRERRTFRQ